ncbi:hypothetical protein SDC9_176181 [bioreactor metagenome]|uniref:Uncharacterized protein n=1 Tax=bioreactor metagenome TaxID=1076179 RepID=A0A645GRB4_9ZZZZ
MPLTAVSAVPLVSAGGAGVDDLQVENLLAAIGAAWALGIAPELIRAGVETFDVLPADAAKRA